MKGKGLNIVIACNTLHKFLDFEMNPGLKFIHLINEKGTYLKRKMIEHTLLICTDASVNSKLHQACFSCRYPDEALQHNCQEFIDRILAGEHKEEDENKLYALLKRF